MEWNRRASSLRLPHTRSPTRGAAADPTGAAPLWPHAGPGHTKRKAQAYGLIMALISIGFKPFQNLHKFHIFPMSKCPSQWCSVRPHRCATVPTVHVQGSFHLPGQELCPQETRMPPPQPPHRVPGALSAPGTACPCTDAGFVLPCPVPVTEHDIIKALPHRSVVRMAFPRLNNIPRCAETVLLLQT